MPSRTRTLPLLACRTACVEAIQPDNPCQTESGLTYSKHSTGTFSARQFFGGRVGLQNLKFSPSPNLPPLVRPKGKTLWRIAKRGGILVHRNLSGSGV